MIPIKCKTIIQEYLDHKGYTGEKRELVESLINFQFIALKKEFSNISVDKLYLNTLGTFFPKAWTIKRDIDKYDYYIKKERENKKLTYAKKVKLADIELELNFLNSVYKKMQEKYAINGKRLKEKYELKGEDTTSMDQPESNS